MQHGSTSRNPLTLLLFCLFVLPASLFAQRPNAVELPPLPKDWAPALIKMQCNDAGNISQFSGFQLTSTSFGDALAATDVRDYADRPDTIYLCAGDQFTVGIDPASTDLTGDPITSTTPGVGFAFYRCAPTVTGPTLMDISNDPCVADDGLPPFNTLAIGFGTDYASGDYTYTVANDGNGANTIPALFPVAGEPTPIVLTLAPITFDAVNDQNVAFYEGLNTQEFGLCVDVSTDQSFRVAYLNPVNVANLGVNPNEACEGLFDVRGGTPELLGGTGYDITIENTVTGALAVITTPATDIVHNAVVNYTVPEPGEYRITILDENSCPLEETLITHTEGCVLPVVVNLPFVTGLTGTNVCVPVTMDNFSDVTGFQLEVGFDPTVLQFTGLVNQNGGLTGGVQFNGPPSSGGNRPDGTIRIIYSDNFGGPATLPNGSVVFELCFDIFGAFGTQSPLICIPEDPGVVIPSVYTRADGEQGDLSCNPGALSVTDQAFLLELTGQSELCEDQDDGRIIATASGAPDPYIFSIRQIAPVNQPVFGDDQTRLGNPATAEFSGLEPGTYEIRATSANGEVVISDVEVGDAPELGVNIRVFETPTCNGFSDGILVAEVFNPDQVPDPVGAGYTFTWEGFTETSDTLRGLEADNNYEVIVTSPNGCVATDPGGTLTQPSAVNINTVGVVDATCNGAENGSISVNASGGEGPYDFDWQDATLGMDVDVTASSRTMLPAGSYEIIATDSRMCADTVTFLVDTIKVLGIVSVVDSVTCFGDADGQISVNGTARGAFPDGNYFVRLNNLTTATIGAEMEILDNSIPFPFPGLDVGTYEVVLRDEDPAGCEVRDTFEIFQPDLLEIGDLEITNETCTTGMDGSVTAPVTGGTAPYVYQVINDSLDTPLDTTLMNGETLLTGLSADTNYVLVVTDANLCTDTVTFRINAPAGATLLPIDTSFITCPNSGDGQLSVVATAPQGETITLIEWREFFPETNTVGPLLSNQLTTMANLDVGVYVVQITTSNACVAQAFGVVSSPGEVFLEGFVQNNPQCPGDANGSIFVNPGGGTPNGDGTYNYVLSTPANPFGEPSTTNPAFTNLTAGEYTITILDGNGCQPPFDTTFQLVDPPAITGTFAITDVSCPDDMTNDGSATFTAEYEDGTQGTFDFLWTSGTADFSTTISTENGLTRGPVTVRVTDGVCSMSFTDTIRSPEEFVVDLDVEDVSCNGLDDGGASVTVTGGTPGYDYNWSASTENDAMIGGLVAGTMYTLDVTDANNCAVEQQTFTVREPDPLTLSIDPVATTETVRCAGDANGRISVFISSVNNNDLTAAPYSWSGNVADPTSTVAEDLLPGTYGVTVTDVEGCQDSLSYTIGEPEAITFNVLPIEEPLCFGETTPVLIDTAFGGTSDGIEDFTFSVNNDGFRIPVGQTGSAFAGDIVVTVFDSVGCSADQTFSINQPPQIIVDLPEEIVVELGDSLTRLNPLISPAGDVYEYQWTPADFLSSDTVRNPLIFPFEDRLYTLTVTNANQCQAFADIFVEVDANRNVYIPNVFSPNRDGRNEDFRIFACQGVSRVVDVKVFDRWGGVVFEGDDFDPNCLDGIKLWEGEGRNGKPVNPGVFVYVIEVEFLDGAKLVYRGDITVLR